MLGVQLRGFPAWFAARTYHLVMMPGMARKVRLMVDWTVGLMFGRATAELGQLGHPAALEHEAREEPVAERVSGLAFREGGRAIFTRRSRSARRRCATRRAVERNLLPADRRRDPGDSE